VFAAMSRPSKLNLALKLAVGGWLALTVLLGAAVLNPPTVGAPPSQLALHVTDDGRSVTFRVDGQVSCAEDVRK